MASRQIDRLRRKFVNKFFVKRANGHIEKVAFVTGIEYLKKNSYEIRYISIRLDNEFDEIIIRKQAHSLLYQFIDKFESRGNKWAEGFMEKVLDELRLFGKGVIDV